MSTGETSPADWGDTTPEEWAAEFGIVWDFSTSEDSEKPGVLNAPEIEPDDPILQNIFANYYEINKASDSPIRKQNLDHNVYFSFRENSVRFEAKSLEPPFDKHDFSLGYYWCGDYIFYPELFDLSGEVDMSGAKTLIKDIVGAKHVQALERFDNSQSRERVDYSHQWIQGLHNEMAEFFDEDTINELLARHHHWVDKEDKPHKPLFADGNTRAIIGLKTDRLGYTPPGELPEPVIDDNRIVVKIMGPYSTPDDDPENCLKKRQDILVIDVVKRCPIMYSTDKMSGLVKDEDYEDPDFEDSQFKDINYMISLYQLDSCVELAQKVRDLAAKFSKYGHGFDKLNVGVKLKPGEKVSY